MVSTTPSTVTGRADPDVGRAGRVGAWVVLLGTVVTTLGISWDIEWHRDVGPDTFFTLSHLALYAGSALSGIASLVMVLLSTAAQRAGKPVARTVGGTPVRVFGGAFTAPLGYLVAGSGAALFLLYGLVDLWWHTVYGFDATLKTPSHVSLFLSITTTMTGSIIVFAAAREQRWARIGVMVAIPIFITFSPITMNALDSVPLPVPPVLLGIIFFSAMMLVIGALILSHPGGAIGIAVVMAALQAFLWWFSPWAAHTYAASISLPLRDNLQAQPPELPSAMPMFLIVAAAAVEGLFFLGRHRKTVGKALVPLTGAAAGLIIAVSLPLQMTMTDPTSNFGLVEVVVIALIGIACGSVAGFLGSRFTTMLRALAPVPQETR